MSRPTHEEWISEIIGTAADDVSAIRVALETMQQAIVRIADKLDEPPMSAWPRVALYGTEAAAFKVIVRALGSIDGLSTVLAAVLAEVAHPQIDGVACSHEEGLIANAAYNIREALRIKSGV